MINRYAEHRESNLGSVPNSSRPLKGTGLLGDFSVRKMNFNDDIVGIAIATGIPIEWIREQLCTEVNKYAVSADDLSAAVVRGVILGYSFDTALETATAYIARGFRPCDINYIPLI